MTDKNHAIARTEFDTRLVALIESAHDMGLWEGGDLDRMRVTLAVRRQVANTPLLRDCTVESIARAALDAHIAGLMPDGREGYLIPRRNKKLGIIECHFLASWRGLQSIACEDGGFRAVTAEVVREHDSFKWRAGLNPVLEHEPARKNPGRNILSYAIGWPKDGSDPVFVVVDGDDIRAARATGGKVWKTHEAAMYRKTAVRRLTDRVIHSPTARSRLAAALAGEDRMADNQTRESTAGRAAAIGAAIMPPPLTSLPNEKPPEAPAEEVVDRATGEILQPGVAEQSPPDEIGVAEATEPHQPVPVRSPGRSPDDEAIVDAINAKMVRYRKEKAPGKKWTALQDEAVANGLEFDAESGKYRAA